ncbi:hypothetical protein CWN49_37310, partial [Klebsiella michiganensis]
ACSCNITIPKRKGIQKSSITREKNLLRDCTQIPVNYFFESCAFKTVNFITDCAITYFPAVLC